MRHRHAYAVYTANGDSFTCFLRRYTRILPDVTFSLPVTIRKVTVSGQVPL